ncbi:MAG: hypothetical protein WC451_05730 [Patescibacteria group bacterium]
MTRQQMKNKLHQRLAAAIHDRDATAVSSALQDGAEIERRIGGKYPLVLAVENSDMGVISALREFEISEYQWAAASEAAADADAAVRGAIANRDKFVPKPLIQPCRALGHLRLMA